MTNFNEERFILPKRSKVLLLSGVTLLSVATFGGVKATAATPTINSNSVTSTETPATTTTDLGSVTSTETPATTTTDSGSVASTETSASSTTNTGVSKERKTVTALKEAASTLPTITSDAGQSFPSSSGNVSVLIGNTVTISGDQVIHANDKISLNLPTGEWDYSKFQLLNTSDYGTLSVDKDTNQVIFTFDKITSDITANNLSQGKIQFYVYYKDSNWTVDSNTDYGVITGNYQSANNISNFTVANGDVKINATNNDNVTGLRPVAGGYGYYGLLSEQDNYLLGTSYWPSNNSMSFNVVLNPDNAYTNDTNAVLTFSTSAGAKLNADGFYYAKLSDGTVTKLNVVTNANGSISLKIPVMAGVYYDKILFSIIPGSTDPSINYVTTVTYSSDQHASTDFGSIIPINIPSHFVETTASGFIPSVKASDKSLNNSTETVSNIDDWLLTNVIATDVEDDAKGEKVPVTISKDDNYNALVNAINSHQNGTFNITFIAKDSDGNVSNQVVLSDGTTQTLKNGTIKVTLYSNILLHFVDRATGNTIAVDSTLSGNANEAYNTDSFKTIVGSDGKVYSLQNPVSGVYGESDQPKELTLEYVAQKWSLTGSDVTHYVGDPIPDDSAFNIKASDGEGNNISDTAIIDTSSVDWNTPNTYYVRITLPRDNSLGGNLVITQAVYVKANQQKLVGNDYTMYQNEDTPTFVDFGAFASDKTGASVSVAVDLSKADLSKAGVYDVTLSTADGQTKVVKLTVLADQKSITGEDFTMHVGGNQPTATDFKATSTDIDGKSQEVSVDLSKADLSKAGVYDVTLSTADGQTKVVKLTVLADQSGNINQGTNNKPTGQQGSTSQPIAQKLDNNVISENKEVSSNNLDKKSPINQLTGKSLPHTGEKEDKQLTIWASIMLIISGLGVFFRKRLLK